MKFNDNLKEIRKKQHITQVELAKMCHVSQGTIANWESGTRTPDIETITEIASILNVSVDSLVGNEVAKPAANAQKLPSEYIRMVPVFESVSAGFGVGAENAVIEFIPLFIQSDYEYEHTICVRVCGDSMHPQIQDGDLVQVLKQDTAETGDIVVILDGDDAYVKRFIRSKQGITLESFNPNYPPMRFSRVESDRLRIVGIVQRIIRDL